MKKAVKKTAPKRAYTKREKVEHPLTLNDHETRVLRAIVNRLPNEAGGRLSAFGQAMLLDVGEELVTTGKGMTNMAMTAAVNAARRANVLGKKEFVVAQIDDELEAVQKSMR